MKKIIHYAAIATAFVCLPLAAQAALAPDNRPELIVEADGVVNATINGKPVRLLLLADAGSAPVLNRVSAERLGLKPGMIGVAVKIGSVAVKGRTAVARFSIGGSMFKRRVAWFERDIAPGFDGVIGPSTVPQQTVTMSLRDARQGEQLYHLPLTDKGQRGLGYQAKGNTELFVQFDAHRPVTIATAAGAADVASKYGGVFISPPRQSMMRLSVMRPVRTMSLTTPFTLGPLSVDRLDVRTRDHGGANSIPDASDDPDEIVVTAKSEKGRSVRSLHFGRDALEVCSRITFDKVRRQISLSCFAAR